MFHQFPGFPFQRFTSFASPWYDHCPGSSESSRRCTCTASARHTAAGLGSCSSARLGGLVCLVEKWMPFLKDEIQNQDVAEMCKKYVQTMRTAPFFCSNRPLKSLGKKGWSISKNFVVICSPRVLYVLSLGCSCGNELAMVGWFLGLFENVMTSEIRKSLLQTW